MLRMMIVDDEQITLSGLSSCTDWGAFNIGEIRTASNGLQALEIAQVFQPNIILTDIAMPRMDGVELAQRISEILPTCKIIFITGYWELDYCKCAFKSGVADYILKPVDIDELKNTVRTVVKEIQKHQLQLTYMREMEEKLRQALPIMRTKFFISLLSGHITEEIYLRERLSFLEIKMPYDGLYVILAIKTSEITPRPLSESIYDRGLREMALTNIASEIICESWEGLCLEIRESEYFCIVYLNEGTLSVQDLAPEDAITDLAQKLHDAIQQRLGLTVTVGVGKWVSSISAIHQSARIAEILMRQGFFRETGSIILADRIAQRYDTPLSFGEMQRIADLLRIGDLDGVITGVKLILECVRNEPNAGKNYGMGIFAQLFGVILGNILEGTQISDEVLLQCHTDFATMMQCQTLNEVGSTMIGLCEYLHGQLMRNRNQENRIILDVKEYIRQHYREKLTVAQIAGNVYLSPSYVCLLFKQETSTTIVQHITDLRIQESARLIRETNLRMLDISYEVGYQDMKYWSRLFKKNMGKTPSEYKMSL